ncbi:AraC family transcriptional regulator [Nocardioides bizhenqiangii]|uniref:AraC family transcriptional regulator n=1 Tax=Nocardioides bizhenqiangii TaxID=3095076 RepID=A0ABZ0ZMF8_9ACTN|nr:MULTISPECIES: AraC family transcriptional regulator [unclassified Nocardioides]MDZ5620868.1 AraC family transcriptional regulator [Nocardioides sp. HM23]WQQ25230.1 AraC family transcriptional regulator [Nocardioides sp. HM61]
MSEQLSGHDRVPTGLDRNATLSDVLDRMHLQGAVFLRGEYSEAWSYRSPSAADTAALLQPGAPRVALFHVVATGRCWTMLADGQKHWAYEGDVIVLPYGDLHTMGGAQPAEVVDMVTILDMPPWTQMPVVRHGSGGERTDLVCGYLTSDHPLFDPRLRALPPLFVVSPSEAPARGWVQASIDYALAQTSPASQGGLEGPTQVPELLVREVLRIHLASAPQVESGWLQALADPVLAPALAAIHGSPEDRWTVAGLAREANVSVSLLDERFRAVLGLAPIRYLAAWRMHVAGDLLRSTTLGVASVARRVGYESEEAFSRAFKRSTGRSPSTVRRH